MQPERPSKKSDPFLIAFGIYGAVGFQLAATVVGGLLLGSWLDKRLGTDPWLTITGIIVGSIGGFYNLFRIVTWKKGRRRP